MSVNNKDLEYTLLREHNDHNNNAKQETMVRTQDEHKNKLGTLNGCYVPCLLNIMGVILFLRLGWGIGQVGVAGVLLIFVIAEIQAIITILSLCAIITNGTMRGGGSYYMISRTLGPEFGGSIGILFYAAYCVGVAFYASGFAEEVVSTFFADSSNPFWLTNAFSSAILFCCLTIALIGAECFTKINVILFCFQFLAILIALCACFFRGTFALEDQISPCETDAVAQGDYNHYGWTFSRFKENWEITCGACHSFAATFAVLFPAATGIMEGANLSGDLKNAAYSIPVGTLAAVATSIFFYLLLIASFAGSFNSCTLRNDTSIMQEAAWGTFGTYLVISGIIISASSSALGSLFGGSRVLQAIARDKLFPYMKIFEYGSVHGDEPRTAVLITWLIAQCLIFVGGINTIAPISTSFFCLSYATVNLCCFLLAISGTPNFRPSFKYYSWHISLIGTVSNLGVMFYVDWRFGFAAFLIEIGIFAYLIYREPQNVWGDVTQSIIFHQVRKYLLRLDERKRHAKAWRPSILLLADNKYSALIDFCNNLKKGGLYIIGVSINGEFGDFDKTISLRNTWIDFIHSNGLKAFPQINIAPNIRNGLENLILLSGLGALQPNTVILPLIRIHKKQQSINDNDANDKKIDNDINDEEIESIARDRFNTNIIAEYGMDGHELDEFESNQTMTSLVPQSPATMDVNEYSKLCHNILKFNKNLVITANFRSFDSSLIVSDNIQQAFKENASYELEEIEQNKKQEKGHKTNVLSDTFLRKSINHDFIMVDVPKSRQEAQWIDLWLFACDYSFNISNINQNCRDDVFPMLMMQLSHILLRNKVWMKKARVKLRVLLFVDNKWAQNDKMNFDKLLKQLRLNEIHNLIILKEPEKYKKVSWNDVVNGNKKGSHLKKYYNSLNTTIKSLSSETYFTFMKLPKLPPIIDNNDELNRKLNTMYYKSLYVLLRGLAPTALLQTGEINPVISTDL